MGRATKPGVPTKTDYVGDLHTASEINATDTSIDAIIDDYVSQTETGYSQTIPLVQSPSYIIMKSGSYYYALSGSTNKVVYGGSGNAGGVDGTDAAAVINASINALTSGGKIFIKTGTYSITSTIAISTSKIIIEGEGQGTVLSLASGCNDDVISITGTGTIQVQLRNFRIWGEKSGQTSGHGIYINTPYSTYDSLHLVENVDISDVKEHGIYITGDTRVVHLIQVYVNSPDKDGFRIEGSDNKIVACEVGDAKQNGFYVGCTNSHFIASKAFACSADGATYAGWWIQNAVGNTLTACEAEDNKYSGFTLYDTTTKSNTLVNCLSYNNGKAQDGDQTGISIYDAVNCSVIGGSVYDNKGSPTQNNGIWIQNNADDILVVGVTLWGNTNYQIRDTSSGTNRVHNNIGYITENSGTSTGTGSEQTIAHGLADDLTPNTVSVVPTVTGATVSDVWVDATNIYCTVTADKAFKWSASLV